MRWGAINYLLSLLLLCPVLEESVAVGYLDTEIEVICATGMSCHWRNDGSRVPWYRNGGHVCYRYVLSLKKQWQTHLLKMKQKWRSHALQEYLADEEPMAVGYLDIEMEVMCATGMSCHWRTSGSMVSWYRNGGHVCYRYVLSLKLSHWLFPNWSSTYKLYITVLVR